MPNKKELMIPALRSSMGDWVYYIAMLSFKEVASRVSVIENVHSSKSLNDLLQRQLGDRVGQISQYLQTNGLSLMCAFAVCFAIDINVFIIVL